MSQKLVSFKVAKALKEAGYPQGDKNSGDCDVYPLETHKDNWEPYTKEGVLSTRYKCETWRILKAIPYVVAPTYLSTWLWLWREKNIKIENVHNFATYIYGFEEVIQLERYSDPETAIIEGVNYLIENNLIK